MSAWSDADADLSRTVIAEFDPDTAFLQPMAGGDPVAIHGSIADSPMLEPFGPGSSMGTSVVYFFVFMPDITPQPQKGDIVTLNGVTYDISETPTVENGGSTLQLRRNA